MQKHFKRIYLLLVMGCIGCSHSKIKLLNDKVVVIQAEALVVGAKVFTKNGETWVSGSLSLNPERTNHFHGLLNIDVLDSNRQSVEHLDLCFNSIWRKPAYRTPGAYEKPNFRVKLSQSLQPGSVIQFQPELESAKCRRTHEVGSEVIQGGMK